MRFMRSSRSLALLLAAAGLSSANPLPRDDYRAMGYSFLVARDCPQAQQCGYNGYCCSSSEVCTTISGNIATCVAPAACAGGCATTWTETHTYTSTLATCWDTPPEPTVGVDCVPQADDQEACGPICCAGWQTCAYNGQCSAKPGVGEGQTIVVTSNGVVTTQYSAPYRVTGTTTIVSTGTRSDTPTTATAIGASTSTGTVVTGGGTGGHLSGGAIAGIVIGTLAGISLLLLLCFCCIARGLWVALFGKKKDSEKESRERVDIYEERYSRHGSRPPSQHSRRDRHKGWFAGGGGGPSSASERREKKKSGGGKTWLGIAGLAATLLALLNLKKDKRPASTKPARSSRYSDSYYSYSDYTSPSKSTLK